MWAASQGFTNFFVVPNVFEPWDDEQRETLSAEMRKYADYYAESKKNGVKPIKFSSFEQALNDIKTIADAEAKGLYRSMPKCRSEGKCGLGTAKFASIHPNGNLYACQEMTSNEGEESLFYIGSIYSGVDNSRRRALASSFDSVSAWGEYCGECEYDRICDGGCVANNYMVTGKLGGLPEVYCWWKRLLLHEAMRVKEGVS
jgi:radical SAM protein with 4Fe4S-binding SPASM domain